MTLESALSRVLDLIGRRRAEHVTMLETLLRFPSVSADPAHAGDVAACAAHVRGLLETAGFTAEIHRTPGHPIIIGRSPHRDGVPTVLFYGHYDVQPPDPLERWLSPPFEPTHRDGNLVARGSSDDKGQFLAHLLAHAAWTRSAGDLPVNIVWVIEGEEEIGSPSLPAFLAAERANLSAFTAVLSDTAQLAAGIPTICYGLRGLLALEVRVRTARQDLHSGFYGGTVANPALVLSRALAALHDEHGRVTVPGFYDAVRPVSDEERSAWRALPFDEAAFSKYVGGALIGEAGFSTLERRWARPTLDVNGLWSGYTGPGVKTVLPAEATAKITCRLVPDQDPVVLVNSLEDHLRGLLPSSCEATFHRHDSARASLLDPTGPVVEAGRRALKLGFGREPVLTREGGSIPVVSMFTDILGIDTLMIALGRPDDNLHAPNEKFNLDDFHAGVRTSAALLKELAALAR